MTESMNRTLARYLISGLPKPPQKGSTKAASAPTASPVGPFVTTSSIITFPVASTVVSIIWGLAKAVSPTYGASVVIPIIAAFLVGFFIYYIITSQPETKPKTNIEWNIARGIAIINSLYLAAAALGIAEVGSNISSNGSSGS